MWAVRSPNSTWSSSPPPSSSYFRMLSLTSSSGSISRGFACRSFSLRFIHTTNSRTMPAKNKQSSQARLSQGVSDSLHSSLTSFGHFQMAEYICCNDPGDLVCTESRHLLIVFDYKHYWCVWYINTCLYIFTPHFILIPTVITAHLTQFSWLKTNCPCWSYCIWYVPLAASVHLYMYIILHLSPLNVSCISLLIHSRTWICVALFKAKIETSFKWLKPWIKWWDTEQKCVQTLH